MRLHRADLHRRRVRAQEDLLGRAELDVERVLHRARRVRGRDVERFEVVVVVFDLGALHHEVAHAHEDVFELALHLRDEVQVPAFGAVAAEREVEAVAIGRALRVGGRELGAPRLDQRGDRGRGTRRPPSRRPAARGRRGS